MSADTRTAPSPPRPRELPPSPRTWRPDIQGLRAVAVLLVVLYHADVPGLPGGYVGVDVFFVISGFLITRHLLREAERTGRIRLGAFYGARMRRLLPSAVLVAVVTLLAARLWGSIFQVKAVAWDAIFTAGYGLNWRLAEEGIDYQEGGGRVSPLQHFWSLAVEEQFYALWPVLIMLVLVAVGRRHFVPALTVVSVVLILASLRTSIAVTAVNAPMGYFGLHTRAWELALGGLVALSASRLAALPPRWLAPLTWIGLGMVVWSALVYSDATLFPGSAALVPVLGTALVIAAGCPPNPSPLSAERYLSVKPAQGLGRISYALYLWHWPLLVLLPLMFGFDFSWGLKLEVVVLAVAAATYSYWLVERQAARSRRPMRQWFGIGTGLSAASAAAGVAVIATLPALVGGGGSASLVSLDGAGTAKVQQAVVDALSTTQVPSNLTPALAQADGDQPESTRDGCHLDYLQTDQPPCIYGDPGGARTVVLFGDSHAQQWLPALDAAAKTAGWRVIGWTKAACSIADVVLTNDALHREFTECTTWRQQRIDAILAMHPDAVVLSQSDSVPGTQLTNGDWADQTVVTARRLVDAGIETTYVLDTPYPGTPAAECLADNLDDVGACSLDAEHAYPYSGRREQLASTLSGAGVPVVDPHEWFCTTTQCPTVVGSILVYRDASHMSATYAAWLAPLLGPLLEREAGGGSP